MSAGTAGPMRAIVGWRGGSVVVQIILPCGCCSIECTPTPGEARELADGLIRGAATVEALAEADTRLQADAAGRA